MSRLAGDPDGMEPVRASCPRCKSVQPSQRVCEVVKPGRGVWPDLIVGHMYGCLRCRLAYTVIGNEVKAVTRAQGVENEASGDT